MKLELFAYLALLAVGIALAITGMRSWGGGRLTWCFIALYVVAARLAPPDTDFLTYGEALRMKPAMVLANPYFIKEGGYWITSNLLYHWTGSAVATFLIFDFLAVWALFSVRKSLNYPWYFVALCILIFTSVFGIQNVYRQFLATCFLLLALSRKQGGWRWALFIVAGFFHNAAFLFGPLLFAYRLPDDPRPIRQWLFMGGAAAVIALLPVAAGTKSSAETGANLAPLYVAVVACVALLAVSIDRLRIPRRYFGTYLTVSYVMLLSAAATLTLASAQAERIGMIGLFLTLPFLVWYAEHRIRPRWAPRLTLIVALSAPALLFASSRQLLMSS